MVREKQLNQISVQELFHDLQDEMISKYNTNKRAIQHPGAKGGTTEINWVEWLRTYLPKRYTVDKGFVVDHEGSISQEIDVIIYDTQFCPFIFNHDGVKYIPAESVYAVFEVKPKLSSDYVKYAGEKAKSVRVLERTTKPIVGAERNLTAKRPKEIICGLLTASSSWGLKTEENKLIGSLSKDVESRLDLVCCLQTKSYKLDYLRDKITSSSSTENESLIFFFVNLFVKLQDMGNPPAMDIMAYAKAMDSISLKK